MPNCIQDGCGRSFDASKSESRPLITLKVFWSKYCPAHRESASSKLSATFTVVERDPRYPGLTGEHDDSKLESYKYLARIQAQGRNTETTIHADGAITVKSAGLEPMTFVKAVQS